MKNTPLHPGDRIAFHDGNGGIHIGEFTGRNPVFFGVKIGDLKFTVHIANIVPCCRTCGDLKIEEGHGKCLDCLTRPEVAA